MNRRGLLVHQYTVKLADVFSLENVYYFIIIIIIMYVALI